VAQKMTLLGDRLRELRNNRNLTLKQVSDATGLSVSFLSLVERDKVSISVDNLERLARFYQVRLVHLFQGVEDSAVLITRHNDLDKVIQDVQPRSTAFALISYRTGARMEPLMIRVGPGHGDPNFRTHEGDIFVYVLEGKVDLISEKGETDHLDTGDAAYFFGYPGRRILNSSTIESALLLIITSPPTGVRENTLNVLGGVIPTV
jgi:transcriptional regulator with XRE-family HTH domain